MTAVVGVDVVSLQVYVKYAVDGLPTSSIAWSMHMWCQGVARDYMM